MPKAKASSKPKAKDSSSIELRDSMGPIRLPESDPEDLERNDRRELQYLQRLLAARHYQEHERPQILAKIEQLRALLENEPATEAKQEVAR